MTSSLTSRSRTTSGRAGSIASTASAWATVRGNRPEYIPQTVGGGDPVADKPGDGRVIHEPAGLHDCLGLAAHRGSRPDGPGEGRRSRCGEIQSPGRFSPPGVPFPLPGAPRRITLIPFSPGSAAAQQIRRNDASRAEPRSAAGCPWPRRPRSEWMSRRNEVDAEAVHDPARQAPLQETADERQVLDLEPGRQELRQDGQEGQVDRSDERDPGEDLVDVIRRVLPRTNAGMNPPYLRRFSATSFGLKMIET